MALTLVVTIILQGLCETWALLSVTGSEKGTINITCKHSNAYDNIKYFCKDPCESRDILISSSKTDGQGNEKYIIEDRGNIFHVIISSLKMNDSGRHWCGIERYGVDTYNEVMITVKEGENVAEEGPAVNLSRMLIYIGAGLGTMALALGTLLWIFVKRQKRNNSSGKEPGIHYSTLLFKRQRTTLSSPIEPRNQTDDLVYSTVRLGTHSADHDTAAPHSDASL